MELTHLNEITIRVFLTALALSKSSLPSPVQRELNQKVGKTFGNNHRAALSSLMELAKNACLNTLFLQAYEDIQQLETEQERSKFGYPEDLPPKFLGGEIPNTSVVNDVGQLDAPLELADITPPLKPVEIFLAYDSVAAIQDYVEKVREELKTNFNQDVSPAEILHLAPLIY